MSNQVYVGRSWLGVFHHFRASEGSKIALRPRRAQEAPQTPPRRPKTPPRRPQEAPKTPPSRPKTPPRCLQDAPRRSQDVPRQRQAASIVDKKPMLTSRGRFFKKPCKTNEKSMILHPKASHFRIDFDHACSKHLPKPLFSALWPPKCTKKSPY